MLHLLNCGLSPYKIEQFKILLRFLKEYNYYIQYINIINEYIERCINVRTIIYDEREMKYVTATKTNIMYNYVLNQPPLKFLQFNGINNYLRIIWAYYVLDYYLEKNGNCPFDTVDVNECCRIVKVDFKKYCKKWVKEKENRNYRQKK